MKAYYVRELYDGWSVVVFAETAGQAKVEAMRSEYLGDPFDISYTSMRAKRMPKLDKSYRGHTVMEWDLDMQDRVDLYELAGYRCDPDYITDYFCEECQLTDRCNEYKKVFEDE